MRRIILTALVLLPVLACAQTVTTSPITIGWDGTASNYEVAIQSGTEDIIILGSTANTQYYIDLQSSGHFGSFVILVRGYETVDAANYYSEWARSDTEEDVIIVDGVSQTIVYISVEKPTMLRIK